MDNLQSLWQDLERHFQCCVTKRGVKDLTSLKDPSRAMKTRRSYSSHLSSSSGPLSTPPTHSHQSQLNRSNNSPTNTLMERKAADPRRGFSHSTDVEAWIIKPLESYHSPQTTNDQTPIKVAFDKDHWLKEHDRSDMEHVRSDLQVARADRRSAYAVPVQPADRQFRLASIQEIGGKRSSTKPDGSPSRIVDNFLKKKNSLTTEHNKTRLQILERANQYIEESKTAEKWDPGAFTANPKLWSIKKYCGAEFKLEDQVRLSATVPDVSSIRSQEKCLTSFGRIEMCKNLSQQRKDTIMRDILALQADLASRDAQKLQTPVLSFESDFEAMKAFEKCQETKERQRIERKIMKQYGKESELFKYTQITKKHKESIESPRR